MLAVVCILGCILVGGLGALHLAGGPWGDRPLPIGRGLALVLGMSLGSGIGMAVFLFLVTRLRWLTLDQAVDLLRKR